VQPHPREARHRLVVGARGWQPSRDGNLDPLRKGPSYPLMPSVLAALIAENRISMPVRLFQRTETWWTEGDSTVRRERQAFARP
jgi:hypothetical protein